MTSTEPEIDNLEALDWVPCCESPSCGADHPEATHMLMKWCGCDPLICSDCANWVIRHRDVYGIWMCPMCMADLDEITRYDETWKLVPLR